MGGRDACATLHRWQHPPGMPFGGAAEGAAAKNPTANDNLDNLWSPFAQPFAAMASPSPSSSAAAAAVFAMEEAAGTAGQPAGPTAAVAAAFEAHWGVRPAVVARAPGRVNLIGEHIDYEGYGVLPMAIKQACHIAGAWRESAQGAPVVVRVANAQPGIYPAGELPQSTGNEQPAGSPSWLRYVRAAYLGCAEFAAARGSKVPSRGDVLLFVDGAVPPGSGLSSSSALVVAAALALLALWNVPATPHEVAEFTCRCERHVGTQGGGMDQAVSLLAQPGVALRVEFNPVRASLVPVPAGGTFVVANSLAPSLKAETASSRFNLRVLECRLAAMLLAKQLGLDWHGVQVLREVEGPLAELAGHQQQQQQQQQRGMAGVLAVVQQLLPQDCYGVPQVAASLGVGQEELCAALPAALQAAAAPSPGLRLRQRTLHVFSEAQRVRDFETACVGLTPPAANGDTLSRLGELMDASHTSCSQLYECSCPELDALVDVARKAGAVGARLTGAGWGGCTVSLVREEDAPRFIAALREQYYAPLVEKGVAKEEECLFISTPSAGASVVRLEGRGEAAPAPVAAAPVAV